MITPKNVVARTLVIILLFIDIHTLSIFLRFPNKMKFVLSTFSESLLTDSHRAYMKLIQFTTYNVDAHSSI